MRDSGKYYVADKGFEKLFNAGVLRSHNELIMDTNGFQSIPISTSKFLGTWQLKNVLKKLRNKSLTVFHFPIYPTPYKLLLSLLKWKKIPAAVIIIDIDGLRDKSTELLQNEVKQLRKFDYAVVHNDAMKEFLQPHLPKTKLYPINIFDYPLPGEIALRNYSNVICFAGNLQKASFIYHIQSSNKFELNAYGERNKSNDVADNFHYKGLFRPSELPCKLEGSFGLIWDGDSVNECDEYLRYNNPHKFSLYMAAGLPVIVWEQSAIASFVKENNIGVTINHISDIDESIIMNEVDYTRMQQNVIKIGTQVRKGFYLSNVLKSIEKDLST